MELIRCTRRDSNYVTVINPRFVAIYGPLGDGKGGTWVTMADGTRSDIYLTDAFESFDTAMTNALRGL